ncbi:hypothetical protein [Aquabacterium sp.]|uniref:hypothetical protein n=1 Tax=Aquabacterium sp. TaxID=1872578 RepID=UPI003D6D9B3E
MNAIVASEHTTPIGQGTANTIAGSTVSIQVRAEPMTYLRLDTGEVYAIPAADVPALHNEFDTWNRLIHAQLLANEVLALADERLLLIATAKASNPLSISKDIEDDARAAQGLSVKWREETTEAVRKEMQALDKLGSAGKSLIEMVPLMDKAGDKPYKVTPDKANGDWKQKGLDLNRKWNVKTGVGLKDKFEQEARYRGLGPLRYVNSETLGKKNWPKFKDKKSMKWAEVYQKDQSGKRKIDRTKLKQYLGEQVMAAKVSSKDFVKLEISNVGTLGPESLEKWNANAHASGEGKVVWGDVELGDVDFSAEAAAMRYYSGGSLSGEIAPLKGSVNLKAEGSVEVAFAEGKAAGNLYLPSKEGVLLYYLDAEQLVDVAKGKSVDSGRYDLGAIRLACSAELKGVIGVSLAGEVSIGVEMKDIDAQDVDGKAKPGKMPQIKGSRRKTRRRKAVDVTGTDDDWKDTAGVAVEVSFFAGAKGGLGISGAVQWRNPHSQDKKFEVFASIAPQLEGMLGLAGSAKLNIDYVDGIFRITAHAGICLGIGAEGTVTMAVGAKQLASFVYWMYYNLLNAGFRSLVFIAKRAFEALKYLGYVLVAEGKDVAAYFGKGELALSKAVDDLNTKFKEESANLALARRVLDNLEGVRFSTPESKGMLIYQLTRFGAVSWALDGGGLGNAYLPTQRKAVLAVLRQATIASDLKNVIQHIHPQGKKTSLDRNLGELKNFFAAEGPGGLDLPGIRTDYQNQFQQMVRKTMDPHFIAMGRAGTVDQLAMNGDFGAWYDAVLPSLMDEPVRGQMALASSDPGYALLRESLHRDHPLFASAEGGFYCDMA